MEQLFDTTDIRVRYRPVVHETPRCCNCGTSWSWHWSEHKGYPVCGRCLGLAEPPIGGAA